MPWHALVSSAGQKRLEIICLSLRPACHPTRATAVSTHGTDALRVGTHLRDAPKRHDRKYDLMPEQGYPRVIPSISAAEGFRCAAANASGPGAQGSAEAMRLLACGTPTARLRH